MLTHRKPGHQTLEGATQMDRQRFVQAQPTPYAMPQTVASTVVVPPNAYGVAGFAAAGAGIWGSDPLAYAFTPGTATPESAAVPTTLAAQDPALVTVARGVRVRSKLVSWSTYSWSWILFVLAFIVGNGVLMILAGLDMTGIGIGSPILFSIWHFVMFVIFGALLIRTWIMFSGETLLEEKIRLPFLCFDAMVYNFAMSIAYFAWILDNESAYAEVHFSSNSQAYVSFVAMNAVTFLWFYLVLAQIRTAWHIHYNQRKALELADLLLSVEDEHLVMLHRTNLQSVVASLRAQHGLGPVPQHFHQAIT